MHAYMYTCTYTYMHVHPWKSQDSVLQTFCFKSQLQPTALVKWGLEVSTLKIPPSVFSLRRLSLLPCHLLACQHANMCFGSLLNHFVKPLPIFWFWTISLQWLVTIYYFFLARLKNPFHQLCWQHILFFTAFHSCNLNHKVPGTWHAALAPQTYENILRGSTQKAKDNLWALDTVLWLSVWVAFSVAFGNMEKHYTTLVYVYAHSSMIYPKLFKTWLENNLVLNSLE